MDLCDGYGERIAKAREARDWSHRRLEEEIDDRKFRYKGKPFHVGHRSIGNYEAERQKPSMAAVLAIALTLGVNPAWILDERAPYTWDPKKESGLRAADVRRVARWMLDYAKKDGPIERGRVEAEDIAGEKLRDDSGTPQQQDAG